jgi:hypothetical protein
MSGLGLDSQGRQLGVHELPNRSRGAVVLVAAVGAAEGSRAAAAALACACSEPDRAALFVDLAVRRAPRPALIATATARELEERLAANLPSAGAASRGATCHLGPLAARGAPVAPGGVDEEGALGLLATALPLVRESVAVVHLPPALLQPLLADGRIIPSAALLRADLPADRALTALATGDLIDRGLRVAVLKRPLAWLPARAALFGVSPSGDAGLPARLVERLLTFEDKEFPNCYDRKDGQGSDKATARTQRGREGR